MATTSPQAEKPVQRSIETKLEAAFSPFQHLEVINESSGHNVPRGSETHFKVVVVSDKFEGLKLIERHRLVQSTLDAELQGGVHALSIVAKTPAQWEDKPVIPPSPNCLYMMVR
ncbi:BolA-like protein 1 [Hondaea fermentalgiana]|uniref:BolA-like protein 1 n=1 Tax=Hondaea fermentalgiana TaxID=2315210 RepID=A0A2R5G8N5_9STRA|nr:BolA-like protein 1 [Hondaea fermentalgiana]|eukprot:GBG24843.1 BolA-like protein 1 [Hondaea fermentalgiana]